MERRSSLVPVFGLIAGLGTVLGSAFVWFKVRADTSRLAGGRVLTRSVNGTETSDGKITLGVGILVIVAAVLLLVIRKRAGRISLSIIVMAGGLAAGAFALVDLVTAKRQVIDEAVKQAAGASISASQIRSFLERAFDVGILKLTPGIGILLVVAGGALALAAGVMGLILRPAEAAPAVVPSAGGESAVDQQPMGEPQPPLLG